MHLLQNKKTLSMTIFWILFPELEICLFMNVINPNLYESNKDIVIVLAVSGIKNVEHLMTRHTSFSFLHVKQQSIWVNGIHFVPNYQVILMKKLLKSDAQCEKPLIFSKYKLEIV